ncbi:MAG: hypothetical protein ACREOH_00500, partial [Candidatus Entotheonellia bacterium]
MTPEEPHPNHIPVGAAKERSDGTAVGLFSRAIRSLPVYDNTITVGPRGMTGASISNGAKLVLS